MTPFGKQPGFDALDWQVRAVELALADASMQVTDIDAVYAGYASTLQHLMPANLLAERTGIRPKIAAGYSVGGATGLSMLAAAARLIRSGDAHAVLVAGGEDRASGTTATSATQRLAQVGHPTLEVPTGCTIPGYYALLASNYLWRYGLAPNSLAPVAVQMRAHAASTDGAHFVEPITEADVSGSRIIAEPLHLLDCCPRSDGGAAFVLTDTPVRPNDVVVSGLGEAHLHQHITAASLDEFGAGRAATRAMRQAGVTIEDIEIAGIYDSFTITLALLLEEIGFAEPGRAPALARDGYYDRHGRLPLNTHGGLLSYGHCGVAGGMAHVVEVVRQMRGDANASERVPSVGFVHADGGVMSAHVSAVLTTT
jgi:acetyl-CoA acetyltransferase